MRKAFTLIELAVTLCILSILSAIAVPFAGRLLDGIYVHGAVIEIESLFSTARHLAIARAASYSVMPITKVAHNSHAELVRAEEG